MSTRQGRRIPDNWITFGIDANNYETLSASLFQAAVKIEGLDKFMAAAHGDAYGGAVPKVTSDYIAGILYRRGKIAYDKKTGLWLPFYGEGHANAYGDYKRYVLVSPYNTVRRPAEDVMIFKANSAGTGLINYARLKAMRIANFDLAIDQNLDAIKETTLIVTDDKELSVKAEEADKARRNGAKIVVLERSVARVNDIQMMSTGANYYVNNLQEARRTEYVELLHMSGVRTPIEKGERLITSEVETQNSEADAYISVLIRTFNQCVQRQDAEPLKAVYEPLRPEEAITDKPQETPQDANDEV